MTPNPNVRLVKKRGAIYAEIPYELAKQWTADETTTALETHNVEPDRRGEYQYKHGAMGDVTHVLLPVREA